MKKAVLVLIAGLFTITACQKQETIKTEHPKPAQIMSGQSGLNPGNPDNPLDSVGIIHNLLLSFYSEKGLTYQSAFPKDSFYVWTNSFMVNNLNLTNFIEIEENEKFRDNINAGYDEDIRESYLSAVHADYTSGLISHEALVDMDSITGIVSSIVSLDTLTTITLQDKIDKINWVENLVTSSSLSTFDKRYVLSQASVFGHSLGFWYSGSFGNGGFVPQVAPSDPTSGDYGLTKKDISRIAFADARGAEIAIASGAADWAVLLSGGNPAAGLAVIAATAAAFSANEAIEIAKHG